MFKFPLVGSCLLYAWFAISFSSLSSCVLATTPITNETVWLKECNNQTWGETVSFKNTRKLLICVWYKTIMEECAWQSVICQQLVIASLCFHFCFVLFFSTVLQYFVPTFANNLAFLFIYWLFVMRNHHGFSISELQYSVPPLAQDIPGTAGQEVKA